MVVVFFDTKKGEHVTINNVYSVLDDKNDGFVTVCWSNKDETREYSIDIPKEYLTSINVSAVDERETGDLLQSNDLKKVLKDFDEHGWKGSFNRGPWEIASGGYDCWFELCYKEMPVAKCIAGELESNASNIDDFEKEKMFNIILEVYDHLKLVDSDKKTDYSFKDDLFDYISDYRDVWFDLSYDEIQGIVSRPELVNSICEEVQEYLDFEGLSFDDADFSKYGMNSVGEKIFNIANEIISEYKHKNGLSIRRDLREVIKSCEEMSKKGDVEFKKNEYFKTSDGFFDYFVNRKTGEKKFKLDENDVEVENNFDDFWRGDGGR